ncbi:methylenetetrahydrofolate reductase [Arthrobacter sp. GMC3]|uniref:methylenetetrahydrofolate reductase n=1 Tax=Arthrobacter sp. GMC3 TaxID=2058894 RepID=UPI0021579831|nr:methylenetetrahydrofolate reductase [Arthrobacter sp. GMC3]
MLPTRLEIIPTDGIVAAVRAQVPAGATVTVTCLPHHGVERTMDTAQMLAGHGFNAVPHLAARSIESREQLASIVRACTTSGITEVFVIGGDKAQPAGPFASGESLMREIAELSANTLTMGVAGYPEGHPAISDNQLLESLQAKQELASHIVTQMCFSPAVIGDYMDTLRTEGVGLPVLAGVAGNVPRTKLLLLAAKIGVGSSLKFISGKGALSRSLLIGSRYQSGELIRALTSLPHPPAGVHLYTFNNLDSEPVAEVAG